MDLLTLMAKSCYYAQEHVDDPEAWACSERCRYFTCVSYQVACFLAQNTVDGHEGVDCNIVIDELIARPMKTEQQWEKIIQAKVKELGGWIKSNK